MKFRLDIQGLRALAVIFVIIFHVERDWLPGGFLGVDMFFVISGFLISKGLIKKFKYNSFDFKKFIIGRFQRILPAYFAMLIVTAVFALIMFIPADALTFLYHFRKAFVFTSNQAFAFASDYFGTKSHENPLLHTWSLSVEMQFYLALPITMLILPKSVYKWLLIAVALLVLFYTNYQVDVLHNKQVMYFSTLARSPEFVVGIAINFIPDSKKISLILKNVLGIGALVVILLSCFYINEKSVFPGLLSMPVCLAVAIIIWLEDTRINEVLGNNLLAFIGKISYSLYLWHWPVLAFYRYYTGDYSIGVEEIFYIIIITGVISILSYYLIEEPIRLLDNKRFYLILVLSSLTLLTIWYFGRGYYKKIQLFERDYTSFNCLKINKPGEYQGYSLLGDTFKSDDKIVLLGDSHAYVMTGFFDVVGKENNFNFSYHTINSIVPLEGIHDSIIQVGYRKQYYDALPITNDLIENSKIIFLVKHWQGSNNGYYKDVLYKLIKRIGVDKDLVIVSDFPKLEKNPVREYRSIVKPVGFKPKKNTYPNMPKGVQTLIDNYENVHYLNLRSEEFFKNAPYYNDTLMYYDESHINYYGSINYAKFEGQKLADLIKEIKNK